MEALQVSDAPSWTKFLTDFDATKRLFDENYSGLLAQRSFIINEHPELLPEFVKMTTEAREHKAVLDKLASVKATVSGWLNSVRGIFASGLTAVGLGELGIVPVVLGVAAATAALATIGYWIKDAYQFSRRLNELQRLEGTGLSPSEASKIVDRTLGTTGASLFGIDIKWLIVGGALLFFGPALLKLFRSR